MWLLWRRLVLDLWLEIRACREKDPDFSPLTGEKMCHGCCGDLKENSTHREWHYEEM